MRTFWFSSKLTFKFSRNSFFCLWNIISNSLYSMSCKIFYMLWIMTSFSVLGRIRKIRDFSSIFCFVKNWSSMSGRFLVFRTVFPLEILNNNFSNFKMFLVGTKARIVWNFFDCLSLFEF